MGHDVVSIAVHQGPMSKPVHKFIGVGRLENIVDII